MAKKFTKGAVLEELNYNGPFYPKEIDVFHNAYATVPFGDDDKPVIDAGMSLFEDSGGEVVFFMTTQGPSTTIRSSKEVIRWEKRLIFLTHNGHVAVYVPSQSETTGEYEQHTAMFAKPTVTDADLAKVAKLLSEAYIKRIKKA